MIEKAKRIAAGLLLIASLLPLAQCKSKEPVQPRNTETRMPLQQLGNPQHPPMGRPIYVLQAVKASDPQSWAFALAFVWPVPLTLVRWRTDSNRIKVIIRILEIPLCALTVYYLYWFVCGPWRLLSGGDLALTGITVYMAAIVADVVRWQWKRLITDQP